MQIHGGTEWYEDDIGVEVGEDGGSSHPRDPPLNGISSDSLGNRLTYVTDNMSRDSQSILSANLRNPSDVRCL
jgi:hypothetical protein